MHTQIQLYRLLDVELDPKIVIKQKQIEGFSFSLPSFLYVSLHFCSLPVFTISFLIFLSPQHHPQHNLYSLIFNFPFRYQYFPLSLVSSATLSPSIYLHIHLFSFLPWNIHISCLFLLPVPRLAAYRFLSMWRRLGELWSLSITLLSLK